MAAGRVPEIEAVAKQFWPPPFIDAVDAALARYERDVEALDVTDREAVRRAVERVRQALNEHHRLIERSERDELNAFLQRVLTLHGVDAHGLTFLEGR
ncbi:hypothetical protein ACTI_40700 [Actinoplanes sp. OR16]|nr:hypothetical protein ACTI_40700 [Actinoplanes sp. OR16]